MRCFWTRPRHISLKWLRHVPAGPECRSWLRRCLNGRVMNCRRSKATRRPWNWGSGVPVRSTASCCSCWSGTVTWMRIASSASSKSNGRHSPRSSAVWPPKFLSGWKTSTGHWSWLAAMRPAPAITVITCGSAEFSASRASAPRTTAERPSRSLYGATRKGSCGPRSNWPKTRRLPGYPSCSSLPERASGTGRCRPSRRRRPAFP